MAKLWEHLLTRDEEILWQGAPKVKVRLEWENPLVPFLSIFFISFSLIWMSKAISNGGFLWMFRLLFFGIGAYGLIGIHYWKAFIRRHQYYTLTNQRAMISTTILGRRKLRTYPITKTTEITFEDNGETGDLYFAKEVRHRDDTPLVTEIGFEQILNPRQVFSLMRQIQEGR
ncbi:MAG: hypothetical protein ABJN04_12070 [Hyphomicrobiales bacterium]